jgi:phage-related protein
VVVTAATKGVAIHGNSVAHHLRGDIYEVRARTANQQLRILYATEGRSDQVLLALRVISKKSRTVPGSDVSTAEQRLKDWRSRGRDH